MRHAISRYVLEEFAGGGAPGGGGIGGSPPRAPFAGHAAGIGVVGGTTAGDYAFLEASRTNVVSHEGSEEG